MRILGRLPHPTMQITVFSNDGRFPVQFELGGLAQIYRFRQSDRLKSMADVEKAITEEFLTAVLKQFTQMRQAYSQAMNTFAPPESVSGTDDLPDII